MDRMVSRRSAVGLAAMAVAAAVVGLWLAATAGRVSDAGFLQYATIAVGTSLLGAFVLWHRPSNRYGATHLTIGMLFGFVVLAAGVLGRAAVPGWSAEVALFWSWVSTAPLLPLWVIVIAAFPDGSFHRPSVKKAAITIAVVMPFLAVPAYLLAPPGTPPPLIAVDVPTELAGPFAPAAGTHALFTFLSTAASVLGALAPIGAVVALIDRYRKSGPVRRQQIKWLLAGVTISVALQALPVRAFDSEVMRAVTGALVVLAVPLPLVAAAIAIFKHGLWDIDVVISKGLVYALASGVLSAMFLGIALVAGVTVGGRDSRVLGALALALLVSFAAQPLRRRLEKMVARVLYGDEPRGLIALARLGDAVGPAPDAQQLGSRIADVARTALGASWAGVWLFLPGEGTGSLRPVAVSGAGSGPPRLLPATATEGLAGLARGVPFADIPPGLADVLRPAFVEQPAVMASLVAAGNLIGLIACGPRPKDPFGEEDLELLAAVAREAALALRNTRLEADLRDRLEQIEQQAAELHRSRHRLVAAQDTERRRIERDLHDGVQQQLVGLAARLRRAAYASGPLDDRALNDLADEAEEAIFALQDLARGIYPSLLSDRGLQAALQAHAARVPMNVRVEVGPLLKGRRFHPELEAALYFVGLEAMTNALKHAPDARVVVSLRADTPSRAVTLEVHDDGPGFDTDEVEQGSGLQNMSDRVAAVDGEFSVESAPGAGTWIRAEVPEGAEVRSITDREATP